MKPLKVLVNILLCASTFIMPGRAATLTFADDIIGRIDKRMTTLDSLIFKSEKPLVAPNPLTKSIEYTPDTVYSHAVGAIASARINAIKAETGVQLTGQTYYRLDGALGLDDDDEAVSRYTGKIQVEARWYFLQSGLLKRHGRFDEVNLKADIDRLQHERGRAEPGMYAQREELRAVSDSILAAIMLHRVENLIMLEDAYKYLLNNENISGDDLLRILDDRAEAERRLSTLSIVPQRATGLAFVLAGTVTVDTTLILSVMRNTEIDLQILDMKSKLLECQANNTTWWSDVRIAPFVRYSHYFRHNLPSSGNVDVGFSFTVPVNAEASRRRKAMRAEKNLLDCERNDMIDRLTDRVRYLARETERQNRAIVGEWHRAASLRNYLKVRRNAYNNREGEYNRIIALKEYNSYIRCLENIVEIQYRRDCLLADIQTLIPLVPILDYCKFTPLTSENITNE